MTTMTVRSEIGDDGKLHLEVPCQLPPGPVEVVLVVQPAPDNSTPSSSYPRRARSGLFLGKAPTGVDLDAVTGEMNSEWKNKLADLKQ
jgi:hypothetical protein